MTAAIHFLDDSYASNPGLDTAVSRALLLRVSDGSIPETFRLHVPGRVVAFGKRDTLSAGYAAAIEAARAGGFEAVERLVGGRAAVFHEGVFAFSWSIPEEDPRPGIYRRFEMLSGLVVRSLRAMGVDAEVGELPGEYCPGSFSVHSGPIKIMGVGQRLARRAAHIGGVIVVSDGRSVRDILGPVYQALGLAWDHTTAGSIQDVDPTVTMRATADSLLAELRKLAPVERSEIDDETLELAHRLAPEHVPG